MTIYRRNYIKQVILKIDFEKINLLAFDKFDEIGKSINANYDWAFDTINENILEFNNDQVLSQRQLKKAKWTCNLLDRTIEISNEFLLVTYNSYESRETLNNEISLFNEFLKFYDIKGIKRVGLRYINNIDDLGVKSVSDLDGYINADLLGGVKFYSSAGQGDLSRYLTSLFIKRGNIVLGFNYGLWNEQFPSKILNYSFILDYDCYTAIPLEIENDSTLPELIHEFNTFITSQFELSIDSNLRTLLT